MCAAFVLFALCVFRVVVVRGAFGVVLFGACAKFVLFVSMLVL